MRVTRFGLEDAFTGGDADKLAWVAGWRKLPHVDPEVQRLYAYPQRFAQQVFERVERALRSRAAGSAPRTGRLLIVPEGEDAGAALPDVPVRYVLSSDPQLVAAHKAHACDAEELASDRREGHFLLCYETSGGWVAISKDVLTEVLGAGRDAKIVGLPDAAAESLRLTCRALSNPGPCK